MEDVNDKYLDIDIKHMIMVFAFMQMSQGCPQTTQPFGGWGFLNVGVVAGDTQRVMEEREEGVSRGWNDCWAEWEDAWRQRWPS